MKCYIWEIQVGSESGNQAATLLIRAYTIDSALCRANESCEALQKLTSDPLRLVAIAQKFEVAE